MGAGNSREHYASKPRRRSPAPRPGSQRVRRHRRGLSGRIRPAFAQQPILPIGYGSPAFYNVPTPVYLSPMSPSYNNYISPSYMVPQQPMVIPQQPMVMPQQSSPYMFPPYMPSPYSMGMPLSTPYMQQQPPLHAAYNNVGVAAPMRTVYMQQPPQMQPVYNNIGASAPMHTGVTTRLRPYSSPNQGPPIRVVTDWTGGGEISPGFLGPPI